MNSKIDFYHEVLAIEPASRVFFPLARLLVENGDASRAAEVLRAGIAFHPDHLEAKFLLVELLARQGQDDQALACFETVAGVLSNYPAVWSLWAAHCAKLSPDTAIALRFLSASFQNPDLTWATVMDKGLGAGASPAQSGSRAAGPVSIGFNLRGAEEVMALTRRIEAPARKPEAASVPPECASEASATVKTKTMADLLAKHGDYASALEIYEELARLAGSTAERDQVAARVAEIKDLMAGVKEATKSPEPDRPKTKARLVSMLETLADRLDARAAG